MSDKAANAARAAGVCALLAAAIAMALFAGCSRGEQGPGPAEATSSVEPVLSGRVEPPSRGAYLGLYRPPAPYDMEAFDSYAETISPRPPAILMWYQPWAESGPHEFDQAWAVAAYQRGAVPMISWEPWNPGVDANFVLDPGTDPEWRLRNILSGTHDTYLRRWAQSVKAVRGPVMIRMMHEMNGDWYPWAGTTNGNTPEEFVKAWRRVHDIFEVEGATNATWVWSFNFESVPDSAENSFSAYYPGDEYVDWVGISGFNWGESSPPDSSWASFRSMYVKPLAYARTLGKPIVIAEFASVEQGGDKAAWITDAYKRIAADHPEVKAVIYYDSLEQGPDDTQDWRIATSPESTDAYAAAVNGAHFVEAPAVTLGRWVDGLSVENWMYLRSLPAIY